jgi:hypothetical protein
MTFPAAAGTIPGAASPLLDEFATGRAVTVASRFKKHMKSQYFLQKTSRILDFKYFLIKTGAATANMRSSYQKIYSTSSAL